MGARSSLSPDFILERVKCSVALFGLPKVRTRTAKIGESAPSRTGHNRPLGTERPRLKRPFSLHHKTAGSFSYRADDTFEANKLASLIADIDLQVLGGSFAGYAAAENGCHTRAASFSS